jgi:hypothetical protein
VNKEQNFDLVKPMVAVSHNRFPKGMALKSQRKRELMEVGQPIWMLASRFIAIA